MSIPIFLILFTTSLRIVFGGSESAITYQRARYRDAADRMVSFKLKYMFSNGSIHHWIYDEDVFTCIHTNRY